MRKPRALHDTVVEVDERVTIEDYDLAPDAAAAHRRALTAARAGTDPDLVATASGDVVRVLRRPDLAAVRAQLRTLQLEGYTSVAIAFVHAYLFPDHEDAVAAEARALGFAHVTTSARTSPVIKLLNRSNATCSEAYLYPVIRRYVAGFEAGFAVLPQRVEFMCSDGGLRAASRFRGNEALLSGPAGGLVGIARSCFDEEQQVPIIGFDMVCFVLRPVRSCPALAPSFAAFSCRAPSCSNHPRAALAPTSRASTASTTTSTRPPLRGALLTFLCSTSPRLSLPPISSIHNCITR